MNDSFSNTWLGEFKSIIYLAMGLIAMLEIPNMLPLLVFLFFILFGFNVFIRVGEVYITKRTENKSLNLVAAAINLIFVIWCAYELLGFSSQPYEQFRDDTFVVISVWLGAVVVWGVIQSLVLLFKKSVLGYIVFSETLLSALLWFFFYRITTSQNEYVWVNFGIFCTILALISFMQLRVAKHISSH